LSGKRSVKEFFVHDEGVSVSGRSFDPLAPDAAADAVPNGTVEGALNVTGIGLLSLVSFPVFSFSFSFSFSLSLEDEEEDFLCRWILSTDSEGGGEPGMDEEEPPEREIAEELVREERGEEPKYAVARAEMDRALWGLMEGAEVGSSIDALTRTAVTSCRTAIHWLMSSAVSALNVLVSFCVMICHVFLASFIGCGLTLASTNEMVFLDDDEDDEDDEDDDEE